MLLICKLGGVKHQYYLTIILTDQIPKEKVTRGDIRVHTHAEEPQRAAGRHAEPPHTWQQHSVQHGSDCLPTKDTKYQVKDEK